MNRLLTETAVLKCAKSKHISASAFQNCRIACEPNVGQNDQMDGPATVLSRWWAVRQRAIQLHRRGEVPYPEGLTGRIGWQDDIGTTVSAFGAIIRNSAKGLLWRVATI